MIKQTYINLLIYIYAYLLLWTILDLALEALQAGDAGPPLRLYYNITFLFFFWPSGSSLQVPGVCSGGGQVILQRLWVDWPLTHSALQSAQPYDLWPFRQDLNPGPPQPELPH